MIPPKANFFIFLRANSTYLLVGACGAQKPITTVSLFSRPHSQLTIGSLYTREISDSYISQSIGRS